MRWVWERLSLSPSGASIEAREYVLFKDYSNKFPPPKTIMLAWINDVRGDGERERDRYSSMHESVTKEHSVVARMATLSLFFYIWHKCPISVRLPRQMNTIAFWYAYKQSPDSLDSQNPKSRQDERTVLPPQ